MHLMCVAVKIMVRSWVPQILGAYYSSKKDPKGDHSFDNHPCEISKQVAPETLKIITVDRLQGST